MAGNVVATLVAKLEADIKGFESGMKKAETRIDGLEASTGKATGGMGKFASAAKVAVGALATKEILDFAKQTLTLAVNAEAAGSMFATTFGPAVDDAQEFVDEMANKMGMANYELQQMMGITANTIQGIGGTEEASRKLSERMVTLAGDVASFANADPSAVLAAMGSAINGEREALKTYGLAVSEAEVQLKAFEMTGKTSESQLSRMDKALATVEVAYGKAGKAIGALDRTQGSMANQMREISGLWKDAQVAIGQGLMPAVEKLLPVVKDLIPIFTELATSATTMFSDVVAAVAYAYEGLNNLDKGGGGWLSKIGQAFMLPVKPLQMAVDAIGRLRAPGGTTFVETLGQVGKNIAEASAPLRDYTQDWKTYADAIDYAAAATSGWSEEQQAAFDKFHDQTFTDPFQLQFQLDAAFINMDTGALRTMMTSLGAVGVDEFTDTFQLSPAADDAVQAAIDAIGLGEAEFQKAIQNLLKIQRAESNFQNNLKTLIAAGLTNTAAWLESRNDPVGAQLLVDSLAAGEGWAEQLEKTLKAGARDAMNATREVIGLDKWLAGWKQLGEDEALARNVKLFNETYRGNLDIFKISSNPLATRGLTEWIAGWKQLGTDQGLARNVKLWYEITKGNLDVFRAAKPIATIGLAEWLKGWASLGSKEGEARNKALQEALKGLVIPPIPGFGTPGTPSTPSAPGGAPTGGAGTYPKGVGDTIVLEVDGRQLSTILRTQTRANTLNGLSP
ncbi:MAG: hypothetical protein ABIJ75_03435 [Actinomycetota bacterium]